MAWGQLQDIQEQNRQDQRRHEIDPPDACPIDGEPLEVNARGVRNCPLGNYQWPRDGKR